MACARILGLLAAAALALAACSGDDTPETPGGVRDAGRAEDSGGSSSDSDGGGLPDTSAEAGAQEPEQSGEATYYNAEGKGACGIPTPPDYLVAAINDEQYSKANCGRCVAVTGPKGTVVVRVIDKCPGCSEGDLDLSETAFTKIAEKSAGRVKITWRFVACP